MRNSIRKIIKEALKPVPKVGDFLYCHTEGVGPKVGDYVKVTDYEHRAGNRGEDIISIEPAAGARFTVQKDVVGRNYEDWFTLIPPDIENIDFFGQLYESEEILKPVPKVGDTLYCHTNTIGARVGDRVEVVGVDNGSGYNGEDCILVAWVNSDADVTRYTIQKDEEGFNYEDWFNLIPPDIQNMDFFKDLYESEDEFGWVKDLDSTNLLKVGQKFLVPSPAKSSGSSPVLAVITKVTDRVVYILPANLPASYPSKGTPFDIGKLLKILNSGAWKVVESNLNESKG